MFSTTISIYFYPLIIALGIISSHTDIKLKIIPNRYVLLSLAAGFLIYSYLILTKKIVLNPMFFANLLLGALIAFILYLTKIWGAGDGKLFFAYCALMPFQKYSSPFFFPAISLFINIFLVSLIGIILISIPAVLKKRNLFAKRIFSLRALRGILLRFLMFFTFGGIFCLYIKKLKLSIPLFFQFIAMLFIYQLILKIIKKIKKTFQLKPQLLIFSTIVLSGVSLGKVIYPDIFSLQAVLHYSKYITCYFILIHILKTTIGLEQRKNSLRLAFAPFMFIGALVSNTALIEKIMYFFSLLKE